jgi:hypothetical protein
VSEVPPPEPVSGSEDPARESERIVSMPKWIPVLIAGILLAIAALAVYTGFATKVRDLGVNLTRRRTSERSIAGGGVPGEPQPGASRIQHGESGENVPEPDPMTVDEGSGMRITARGDDIVASMRMRARRGFVLDVTPRDADVYVNDQPVGAAAQFRGEEAAYEFPAEGNYRVRIVADGHQQAEFLISADPQAREELARIRMSLQRTND